MTEVQTINRHISKEEEGSYFEIPFQVPGQTERIDIEYSYPRRKDFADGGWTLNREVNIVDLAVEAPGGAYVGSSGSDRAHVWVSAGGSADGYADVPARAGTWRIIAGAYKIEDGGVDVAYRITFTRKSRRLLRGDTHMHTRGSDGCMSVGEIAAFSKLLGLDYIFITDHNNYAQNFLKTETEGITVLPGTEWTHYKGHCGMLGVKRPYRSAFCVNSREQAREKLKEAKEAGALLVQNHPFCPQCGWKWEFEDFPFDLVEIWNGGTIPEANADCLTWWESMLERGAKIAVTGGSDFHRPEPLRVVGSPCTCLYALSRDPEDILGALKGGNGYITCSPDGPGVAAQAAGRILGETAPRGSTVSASFSGLKAGDRIRVITGGKTEEILCGPSASRCSMEFSPGEAGFCRFEVRRRLQPGLPELTAMISNPIYFE